MITDAMSTMSNEELIDELIEAAEAVGHELGSDMEIHRAYLNAKARRKQLRKHVLLRLKGTGRACHTDKTI